jgi:D-3-phosphoglycerate dehydrogenase
MSKILFSTSTFEIDNFSDKKILKSCGFELVKNPYKRRLSEKEIKNLLSDNFVGLVAGLEPLTENVLSNASSLKVISRCGIGLDNVDLKFASKRGIKVYNTPDAPSQSVAELTLAHILNLLRNVTYCDRSIRQNLWIRNRGFLLSEKTIGIIGLGRIGLKVANLVSAFGSKVIFTDKLKSSNVGSFESVALERLLEESDIISLHIPYDLESHHFINKETLSKMKHSAILINLSRGGLIDEDALFEALKDKSIQGAGLDAFEKEPYQGKLATLENILLTPHTGSSAIEARIRMEEETLSNLILGLKATGLI